MGARLSPTPLIAGSDAKRFFESTNQLVITDKVRALAVTVAKVVKQTSGDKKR